MFIWAFHFGSFLIFGFFKHQKLNHISLSIYFMILLVLCLSFDNQNSYEIISKMDIQMLKQISKKLDFFFLESIDKMHVRS